MRLRCVGHDHFVTLRAVLEKVVDALFFHQARSEVKIRLAILDAIVPRIECTLNLIGHIQTREDFFQNVGHTYMLEYPALRAVGQEPDLRDYYGFVIRESLISVAVRELADDAVEETFCAILLSDRDCDWLS